LPAFLLGTFYAISPVFTSFITTSRTSSPGKTIWPVSLYDSVVCFLPDLFLLLTVLFSIMIKRGNLLIEKGEHRFNLKALFKESKPYYWKTIAQDLILGTVLLVMVLPCFCLWIVFSRGLKGTDFSPWLGPIETVGVLVFALMISPFLEQCSLAIAIANTEVMDGIRLGWRMYWKHVGTFLLISICTLLPENIIGRLLTGSFNLLAARLMTATTSVSVILSGSVFVLIFLVYVIQWGLMQVFQQSTWTQAFLRLDYRQYLPAEKTATVTNKPPDSPDQQNYWSGR
jgi:hypothetical protein